MNKICFIMFFFCASALAEMDDDLSMNSWRFGAGGEAIGVQSINDENRQWQPSISLNLGYDFAQTWILNLEASVWQRSSQEGSFSVREKNQQGLLWIRYRMDTYFDGAPYLQIGAGWRAGQVESQLGGERILLQKDSELVGALGVGYGWELSPSWQLEGTLKVLRVEGDERFEVGGLLALQYLL